MAKRKTAILILAAGKGTRMKSGLPKVLHPVGGQPLIRHVLAAARSLRPDHAAVVIGPGMEAVTEAVKPWPTLLQKAQAGTGDAVRVAKKMLGGFTGDVLVIFGDTPFLTPQTLKKLLARKRQAPEPAVVVLGMRPADPGEYGRLITGADGVLEAIVEFREANAKIRQIPLCNSGVMAIDGRHLFRLLGRIEKSRVKGEYYLTDLIAIARKEGLPCAYVEGEAWELLGVNDRADLAEAEALFQLECRAAAMAGGATLLDPTTVWFSFDTKLGKDVTIGPNVFFGPGVTVADGATIRAFSHIEGAKIGKSAIVGPFARLRPGADIGEGAHIGNFVEVKKARVEAGAKVNHLTYVGDALIGRDANIGAGTITCNYDGFKKSRTVIGKRAFIGSNTALVAPVTIGNGAVIGAGSVVTKNVAADSLALTRAEQREVKGWGRKQRAKSGASAKRKTKTAGRKKKKG
ncbi:MAG: bifunctional UDP-N-acetylglucosamine diphosphorylase/glucosamine-1-phosphate N-acetyltransferase GlmU [Alphaproteobacteria bacterium]|nr:bifunctional UDP-N-acetylglucosamine diphosphorylase/glucosamine-1-phosphate N-acetyltransferase GlmU [Alphaproteobacteria bacterium]